MKLDLTAVYFNGETITDGNTASWGTALGQERQDYQITIDGAREIIDAMNNPLNAIIFDPINPNHTSNIKRLGSKIVYAAAKFDNVFINDTRIESPFILLVIEETYGAHIGRKNLKLNNETMWSDISNKHFYDLALVHFGYDACWFIHEVTVSNRNELHFSAIKVSDTNMTYADTEERKAAWNALI